MADMRHMHPDLMRAAGFQNKTHERSHRLTLLVVKALQNLVVRDRMTALPVANHGNLQPVHF